MDGKYITQRIILPARNVPARERRIQLSIHEGGKYQLGKVLWHHLDLSLQVMFDKLKPH